MLTLTKKHQLVNRKLPVDTVCLILINITLDSQNYSIVFIIRLMKCADDELIVKLIFSIDCLLNPIYSFENDS